MASKLTNTERLKTKANYALYCVNIFGNGLKTIKDEFKRQINTGLRRNVFVLDLEDLQAVLSSQARNTRLQKYAKENSNTNLIQATHDHIQKILGEYEKLTRKINEELKFDLYEYWLKLNRVIKNNKPDQPNVTKTVKETEIIKRRENEEICTSLLIVKEHTRLGHSKLLSQKKYVEDEPVLGKLYIIILGPISQTFIMDLIRRDQPVGAIINFMPAESNYDIMLGNNKLRKYISSTLETINNSIFNLRKEVILKPVGLFTHQIPVVSNCLATKNSREIFDHLTWCIYDIDVLRHQYENYYFKPFQVTDVEIPAGENITKLYHVAESLNIRGRFQNSIAAYLNSLLSTCGAYEDVTTEKGQNDLLFPSAFSAITNICKLDRLVVAENNKLLLNLLRYADLDDFKAIYSCCLDYDQFGQFAITQQKDALISNIKRDSDDASQLPQYVKYYANKECSWQRIAELKQEYDDYKIRELSDGYRLYIFRRNCYDLKECENVVVIPTRLCFRDFTLFQMEEFLRDLKLPELNSVTDNEKRAKVIDFEKNMFVRSNSLKAITLQKDLSEGVSNLKNESRSGRKSEKGSSLSKNTASEDYQGLPTGHHLLQGYNLDDTLQEVNCKTYTYNFPHGYVKLYEEKLCFREMNKQLSLALNNLTLFVSGALNQHNGISNNVRLVTQDHISIRILNAYSECSRAVMNYPNGLSIYCHDNYCEQIWYCDKTPRDEQKRILTPFGAIIVFFKSQDIKIMRYNGEIYRLYQHEFEEEDDDDDEEIKTKSSELTESNFPKQKLRAKKLSRQNTKSSHSKKLSSEESVKTFSSSKASSSDLLSSLKFELNFLNFMCAIYGLTYVRLSITTSQGRAINVSRQVEFSEKHNCFINEWFDYFANEAYCERSDGVTMIWTQDSFKCFHEDGTVFKTTIEEDCAGADEDEFESLITQSSSHKEIPDQTEESGAQPSATLSSNSDLISSGNNESYRPSDVHFVQLKYQDMFMEHPSYAGVFVQDLGSKSPNLEIFGINGIRISIIKEECLESSSEISEDFVGGKSQIKLVITVGLHNNLNVKVDDESCEVYATIPNSDSLHLSLKYTDNIKDAFNSWVKEIDSFKRNDEHQMRELYFMEKSNCDSSFRGFEFLSSLPTTSSYKYQMSNNIIELKSLDTIDDTMRYSNKEYEKDFNKFPRFKQGTKKKYYHQSPESEIPSSLSANVFIEIPQQLRNLQNITKFLEPFEKIYFKRLRGKFKDALNYYLKPQYQICIQILCSRIHWKRRIREHGRRIFNENQRRGLYIAMIKHKTYPNYWKFTQTYGNDVRCIEFFDFVQTQCNCASD